MKRAPLPDWRLTFENANKHLGALEKAIQRFSKTPAYRGVSKRNVDTGQQSIRAQLKREIPASVRPILQDTLTNFRGSLDQLLYALVIANSPTDERGSAFPICSKEGDFLKFRRDGSLDPRGGVYKIRGVSPEAFATIESLQPYFGGGNAQEHPLWVLNALRNRLHQELHVIHPTAHRSAIQVDAQPIVAGNTVGFFLRGITLRAGPIDHDTEIATFAKQPGAVQPKVKVHISPAITVGFGPKGPAPERPVLDTLFQIRDHIGTVVFPALEPFL